MDKSWEEEEVQGKKVKNPNVGGGGAATPFGRERKFRFRVFCFCSCPKFFCLKITPLCVCVENFYL
jgi:hypothetical protein